jgi:hypothetical protein
MQLYWKSCEADDANDLEKFACAFALDLIGSIMFPDNSGDYVPSFILSILMVIL